MKRCQLFAVLITVAAVVGFPATSRADSRWAEWSPALRQGLPTAVDQPVVDEREPVPVAPGDVAVVAVGTRSGYEILTPAFPEVGGWQVKSRLWVEGLETDRWTGYWCVTGSGRYVAATFAPTQFANHPVLRDRGAFAAIVDLSTGSRWLVPERVALKYHTPGCGVADEVVFVRHLGSDQEATELLRIDAAQRQVLDVRRVEGQLTGAVPYAGEVAAISGRQLVTVDPVGATKVLGGGQGQVFDMHPSAGSALDFLVVGNAGTVIAHRLSQDGSDQELGRAALGALRIAPGRAGANRLVGQPQQVTPGIGVLAAERRPSAVSLDGSLVITDIVEVASNSGDPADTAVTVNAIVTATGERSSALVVAISDDGSDVSSSDRPLSSAPAVVAANITEPRCAVGRNDYRLQVMQPTSAQVEWAAHRAVRGLLTVTRPSGWMRNGLSYSYKPQVVFPRVALSGGGRIPVQVLLGVLAQESNFSQASWHALPGVPGNALIADYYGTVYDADGRIIGMDYDDADCGYGIAQITDHMTASDNYYTADQKTMIATDYAANISVAVQILAQKWNEAYAQTPVALRANNGSVSKIENWYFALWGYNSGLYPNTGSGPYGVGWTNNPANADYPPDRLPFLRTSYEDAAHPGDWPYQEKALGWAERPQLDYQGNDKYADLPGQLLLSTDPYFVCLLEVNECDRDYHHPTNPALDYCMRSDRKCWWHGQVAWISPPTGGTPEYAATYVAGAPEPPTSNPHPPACTKTSSPVRTTPNLSTLPTGSVVVDDVPDKIWNLVGCTGGASAGQFNLSFGTSGSGAPLSAIDFHQIGAGYGGHFWFAHTNDPDRPSHTVTGTWTPPSTMTGWRRIFAHIPDHGADTYQADYRIWTGTKWRHRVVNQRWNENVWIDLGAFKLAAGARIELTNATYGDFDRDRVIDIAWDAVAFAPATKPAVSYVAFGDSYSAGEGLEPYYDNADNGANTGDYKNACHRSPEAYPETTFWELITRHPGGSEFHFQACSGSEMPDVTGSDEQFGEVPQLQQGWLDENTTHVTISIGGNDAGFADVIKGCIITLNPCLSPNFHLTRDGVVDPEPLIEYEPQVIESLQPGLTAMIDGIQALAPNATVALVGYPYVVHMGARRVALGCDIGLDQATVEWFAEMGDLMSLMMEDAASQAGALFADVRGVFIGHEACVDPVDQEWTNAMIAWSSSGSGFTVPGSGSYHPKVLGHFAYRNVVSPLLG